MNESDLSFIGVDIDPVQMKPLETKKIVAFVNYFLIRNVQMLNGFVSEMEQKIVDMERRMDRIEMELKLLQLKLDSVPGLQMILPNVEESSKDASDGTVFSSNTEECALREGTTDNAEISDSNRSEVPASTVIVERSQETVLPETSITEPRNCLRIRDDPRYAVYFKMLKMGVPECAVKQKMASEGVDAAILQTPDALSDLPEDAAVNTEDKGSTSADDDQDSTSSSSEI